MESEGNSSNVDFLHKLPVELWRQILFTIPRHPILSTFDSIDSLLLLTSSYADRAILYDVQKHKLGLLLICKALYPIAEELLYSEIGVSIENLQSKSFQESIMTPLAHKEGHRGEGTTRLWIFAGRLTLSPFDLRTFFPRLRFLHCYSSDYILGRSTFTIEPGWSLEITTLIIYTMVTWDELETMSVCFPRLRVLTIFAGNGEVETDDSKARPISFPQLQLISFSVYASNFLPLHRFLLPSLEWISIYRNLQNNPRQLKSLESFGALHKTLRGAAITIWDRTIYPRHYYNVFNKFMALDTFACHLDAQLRPEDTATSSIRSVELKRLIISITDTKKIAESTKALADFVRPFTSRPHFPHLDEVELRFPEYHNKPSLVPSIAHLVQTIEEFFLDAKVEWKDAKLY